MPPLAARTALIAPFHVMEIIKRADELASAGRSIIHLSIGEPDFGAVESVQRAAMRAIESGATRYTPALGLPELREAIAGDYLDRYGVRLNPDRIIVTAGASGALTLACQALVEPGSEVLMADPCYPCNRQFVIAAGGQAKLIPAGSKQRYQLNTSAAAAAWGEHTRGLLVANPSNPTGTSIERSELAGLLALARQRQGFAIVDEIYGGLVFERAPSSALEIDDEAVVINSFSKYQAMTGWRLGWMVVPEPMVAAVERLAQNLTICASAIAQHAALACFASPAREVFEARRAEFQRRRDFLVPALQAIGLDVPVMPDGAFYIYADIGAHAEDSSSFAAELLEATGVCLVPGKDFGVHGARRHVRISYANALPALEEAVERIGGFLSRRS